MTYNTNRFVREPQFNMILRYLDIDISSRVLVHLHFKLGAGILEDGHVNFDLQYITGILYE